MRLHIFHPDEFGLSQRHLPDCLKMACGGCGETTKGVLVPECPKCFAENSEIGLLCHLEAEADFLHEGRCGLVRGPDGWRAWFGLKDDAAIAAIVPRPTIAAALEQALDA